MILQMSDAVKGMVLFVKWWSWRLKSEKRARWLKEKESSPRAKSHPAKLGGAAKRAIFSIVTARRQDGCASLGIIRTPEELIKKSEKQRSKEGRILRDKMLCRT